MISQAVVISILEDTPWQSCRLITRGLNEAYKKVFQKVQFIELSKHATSIELTDLARKLKDLDPGMIVFIDTWPVYGDFLGVLALRFKQRNARPVIRFHSYGDFALRAYQWNSWKTSLRKFQVQWVVASGKQLKLVRTLLGKVAGKISVCPFPVYDLDFKSNLSLRSKTRLSLGISNKEFVIVYAGRLSLQKNVLAILKCLIHLSPRVQDKIKIIFAGDFDDLGAPFKSISFPIGGFLSLWQNQLDQLEQKWRQKICVVPMLPREQLNRLLCASDAFISLSLMHDEDFGMSPAEAASCGLPLILTDWGGYSDFKKMNLRGDWIKVKLTPQGPLFNLQEVVNAVEKYAEEHKAGLSLRQKQAVGAQKRLSLKAITKILMEENKKLSRKKTFFRGFDKSMKVLEKIYDKEKGHLIYPMSKKGSIYEKIYRNYI